MGLWQMLKSPQMSRFGRSLRNSVRKGRKSAKNSIFLRSSKARSLAKRLENSVDAMVIMAAPIKKAIRRAKEESCARAMVEEPLEIQYSRNRTMVGMDNAVVNLRS